MPLLEHPRNGLWLDTCAPHLRFKVWHAAALLAGMVLWIVLILAVVAAYRALNG